LYAIAAIAIAASGNALAHSYAGLYAWAIHHRLTGWQAKTWPAEIDVFLAVGELALYVAYLDGWPVRQRAWPWATAVTGLAVSVAGNIGHIQPLPGEPVMLADRLTAATSPLAAFAGLTVGLLVLRMNRQRATATARANTMTGQPIPLLAPATANGHQPNGALRLVPLSDSPAQDSADQPTANGNLRRCRGSDPVPSQDSLLLRDAADICQTAAARGQRLSQRMLARALRSHGHRFPNQDLHQIAVAIGLDPAPQQARAPGG
jgi:hypothetical protein